MVHPIGSANEWSPFGSLTAAEFYAQHNITHSSEHITNSRGFKLFTQSWAPLPPAKPLALIAVVHGFTGESSWLVQLTAVHFAKSGFIVCALDHQGHGYSDSLHPNLLHHIPDINPVVNDCVHFFHSFKTQFPYLPSFLYAESLGGAIALYITLRDDQKQAWDGIVLNGAMCGISPKFKPPWPLEHFLSVVAWAVPTWRVVPTRGSIPDVSFKVDWKRRLAIASPNRQVARPRAGTAMELIRVCKDLQGRFEEVDVPSMLIVHGREDVVCDPGCVEELYRRAGSRDKTIRVYEGMWHQLVGEPEENVEVVFGEMVEWLKDRAQRAAEARRDGA